MGPLSLGFNEFVGLRLNEHAFHTWDIEVVFDDGGPPARGRRRRSWSTTSRSSPASLGGRTARQRTIAVHTTGPGT